LRRSLKRYVQHAQQAPPIDRKLKIPDSKHHR
jgi:hypothetical protein